MLVKSAAFASLPRAPEGVSGAAGGAGKALDLSGLRAVNPKLDELLAARPGVKKLIEKLAAAGALAGKQPGDVASKVDFQVWTHSKKSGGMPVEPFDDVIFVWQNDAHGQAKNAMQLGWGVRESGKLIGVFSVEQLAFSSEAEAKEANPKLKVVEFRPGKFLHISDDKSYVGSYEWGNMAVVAHGPKGKDMKVQWAVVAVGEDGSVLGGGFPGGYSGRTFDGKFGVDGAPEMPDH